MTLSKSVLRAYYEACFDGRELARYHGVSFEQYVALMQLKYPSISPWGAVSLAASNNRGDLAKHAADFPPDAPYSMLGRFDELEESHSVRRLTKKDSNLSPGKKAARVPVGHQSLCDGLVVARQPRDALSRIGRMQDRRRWPIPGEERGARRARHVGLFGRVRLGRLCQHVTGQRSDRPFRALRLGAARERRASREPVGLEPAGARSR